MSIALVGWSYMSGAVENQPSAGDPTRLCPVCRTPISILAIRCRFCGAEVGRPRKEQETFTVKDLGGEQKSSYTLSGNVTEALEAFISEERSQIEAKERDRQAAARKSMFRRSKPEDATDSQMSQSSGLPELDANALDLASVATSTSTRSKTIKPREASVADALGRKAIIAAMVIAGIIVLYFGVVFVLPYLRGSGGIGGDDFVYPNRAEEFYSSGLPLVEVLEESLTALKHNNTQENIDIAEKMRRRLIEQVEAEAFAVPFDMYKLNNASKDINRAAVVDADPKILGLLEEVNREVASFKFILTKIADDNKNAVFRLNNTYVPEKEQSVTVGDMLLDRFLIKSITPREVRMEDTSPRGAGRLLISRYMESVEALK
jgi:hypothetical protein